MFGRSILPLTPWFVVSLTLCAAGCALLAPPAGGPTTTPATTAEPAPTAAPAAPTSEPSQAPAAPSLPPVTPPKDTTELVFEQHDLKRSFSVHAPAGAAAKRGDLTEDLITVDGKPLFAVGSGEDNMKLRKRDVADLVTRGVGKIVVEDDHGVLWSEKEGKEWKFRVMWNVETTSGRRNACYVLQAQKKQADAERILEMCKTLREKL